MRRIVRSIGERKKGLVLNVYAMCVFLFLMRIHPSINHHNIIISTGIAGEKVRKKGFASNVFAACVFPFLMRAGIIVCFWGPKEKERVLAGTYSCMLYVCFFLRKGSRQTSTVAYRYRYRVGSTILYYAVGVFLFLRTGRYHSLLYIAPGTGNKKGFAQNVYAVCVFLFLRNLTMALSPAGYNRPIGTGG